METETLDRLFLELSQITQAKTGREIELEKRLDKEIAINKYLMKEFVPDSLNRTDIEDLFYGN